MSIHDRILAAARRLAAEGAVERINLTEVARAAGVSWPTVRRHVGSREKLLELLAPELGDAAAAPDTRSRILAAASQVFAQRGLANASLDEVAAAAGLTKGAVYWHFANKNDLLTALLEHRIREQMERAPTGEDLFPPGGDPAVGIATTLQNLFDNCLSDPDWGRLFFEFIASSREPEVREKVRHLYRAMHELIVDRARQLELTGRLAPGISPDVIATLYTAVIDGLILRALIDGPESIRSGMAQQVARILVDGIRPR